MIKRRLLWLLAGAFVGTPLVTTATCDRWGGTVDIYRNDDRRHRDEIVNIPLWPFDERIVIYDDDDYDCYYCW